MTTNTSKPVRPPDRLVTICPTCRGAFGYHVGVPPCRCGTDPQPARLTGDHTG